MSVTLTAEQFSALLEKSSPKKITKNDLTKRTDAMNIDEFIANFKYASVSKLITMELPDYIVFSIIENINSLEDELLPFVCSNHQTKMFYYKENNEWKKGNDFAKKLYNKIYQNAIKQIFSKFDVTEHDDETDDDKIERNFEKSPSNEKQRILCNLCNCDKYPYDKCMDKVLSKLGKQLRE